MHFWYDKGRGEEALCDSFPSLFVLVANKGFGCRR